MKQFIKMGINYIRLLNLLLLFVFILNSNFGISQENKVSEKFSFVIEEGLGKYRQKIKIDDIIRHDIYLNEIGKGYFIVIVDGFSASFRISLFYNFEKFKIESTPKSIFKFSS